MVIALSICLALCAALVFSLRARLNAIDTGIESLVADQRKTPALLLKKGRLLGQSRLQQLVLLHQKLTSDGVSSLLAPTYRQSETAERPPSEERIEETTRHLLRASKARAWYLSYTTRTSPLLRTCSAGIQLTEVLHRLQTRSSDQRHPEESPGISPVTDPALRWCGIAQEYICGDRSDDMTIHLWLGYQSDHPLPVAELERVQSLMATLRREISDLAALESLSTRATEESESRRKKEQFFSHIAHDLRSPLGNLRAILQSMVKGGPTEELVRFGAMNCDRIEQLTADIIVLSKEQAGALRSHPRPFLITDIARGIGNRFSPLASHKKLELHVEEGGSLPAVFADPSHITRVIENLVGNAIKHTWSGSITIASSLLTEGMLRCTISDSGPGIPADKLEQMTKPFHQLHDSITDGVGLGLAIAKLLTETNQGRFSVASEVGTGSQFSIDLPIWRGGDANTPGSDRQSRENARFSE